MPSHKDIVGDNDLLIKINPVMENEEWIGEVNLDIVYGEDNTLPDADLESLILLAKLLCASMPVMQVNDYLRGELVNYVGTYMGEDMSDYQVEEEYKTKHAEVDHIDGNVTHLKFNTKTEGNA